MLVLVASQEGDMKMESLATDLSLSGMKLIVPKALKNDLPVTLSIQMPADDLNSYQNQKSLTMQARICWQREEQGRPACGVEFTNLVGWQRQELEKIFGYYHKAAVYRG